jgi:hypothetical protein
MTGTKSQLKSMTIIGAALTLISAFGGISWLAYDASTNDLCINLTGATTWVIGLTSGGTVLGGVLSWAGRLRATKKIGW